MTYTKRTRRRWIHPGHQYDQKVSLNVSKDQKAEIEEMAASHHLSVSELLRQCLKDHLPLRW